MTSASTEKSICTTMFIQDVSTPLLRLGEVAATTLARCKDAAAIGHAVGTQHSPHCTHNFTSLAKKDSKKNATHLLTHPRIQPSKSSESSLILTVTNVYRNPSFSGKVS